MIHEPESGGASWQPNIAARLFERVAAALSAALPIPGWPPPIFGPHEPDAVERSDPSWEFISSRPLSDVELVAHFERLAAGLRGAIGSSDGPPTITPVEPWADNAAKELTDLARAGDEPGFRCLASCVMPMDEIGECWAGARQRLGLPV